MAETSCTHTHIHTINMYTHTHMRYVNAHTLHMLLHTCTCAYYTHKHIHGHKHTLTAAQRHKASITMAGREGQTRIQPLWSWRGCTHATYSYTHISHKNMCTEKKTRACILKAESRETERDSPHSEDHNIKDRHKRGNDKNDISSTEREQQRLMGECFSSSSDSVRKKH